MFRIGIVISLLVFVASCVNPPDYSVIPEIQFDSISTTYVRAQQDSVTMVISFSDGDGDLGSELTPNLFLLDSRTGYTDSLKIPNLTPEGSVKAITGVITYTRSVFSCIPGKDFDTLHYTIYVEDRAGNQSNMVLTPDIYIECN